MTDKDVLEWAEKNAADLHIDMDKPGLYSVVSFLIIRIIALEEHTAGLSRKLRRFDD